LLLSKSIDIGVKKYIIVKGVIVNETFNFGRLVYWVKFDKWITLGKNWTTLPKNSLPHINS